VHDFRGNYNVTDYRWFDLRDGDSASPNFQQQFGIMRSDYAPKPAFAAYRDLIAGLSCTDRTAPVVAIDALAVRRRILAVSGRADDEGCATGVSRVEVAIARAARGGRCRFVDRRGKLSAPRPCRRPILLDAAGTTAWQLRVRLPLRGRYRVTVRAYDLVNNKQRPRRGQVVRAAS
jgi:hypothetical protein